MSIFKIHKLKGRSSNSRIAFARKIFISLSSIVLIILSALPQCGKPDAKSQNVWDDAEYKAAFVAKHRKKRYEIQNTSATPEAAVQNLLNAFCKPELDPKAWLFNRTEHREIIWPNLPAADAPGVSNNPDSYWAVIETLTGVVWPIMQSWEGDCLKLEKIEYRRDPERYGELLLHYPGELEMRIVKTGQSRPIDFIRTIVEHQGRFKVGQVGPD
ncbi:MAG: hypothetical protein NXI24_11125 [bacterium]|nr:hypothetical protein [bacterium]